MGALKRNMAWHVNSLGRLRGPKIPVAQMRLERERKREGKGHASLRSWKRERSGLLPKAVSLFGEKQGISNSELAKILHVPVEKAILVRHACKNRLEGLLYETRLMMKTDYHVTPAEVAKRLHIVEKEAEKLIQTFWEAENSKQKGRRSARSRHPDLTNPKVRKQKMFAVGFLVSKRPQISENEIAHRLHIPPSEVQILEQEYAHVYRAFLAWERTRRREGLIRIKDVMEEWKISQSLAIAWIKTLGRTLRKNHFF